MSFTKRQPSITSFEDLNDYLSDLEERIAEAFDTGELDTLSLKIWNSAPDKPRNGDVILADGTNYNPGSGAGLYRYQSGSYTKVG